MILIGENTQKLLNIICETKNPSKEQVNGYKMTEREIYKKFTNLSQEKLNTRNDKKNLCQE